MDRLKASEITEEAAVGKRLRAVSHHGEDPLEQVPLGWVWREGDGPKIGEVFWVPETGAIVLGVDDRFTERLSGTLAGYRLEFGIGADGWVDVEDEVAG